MPKEAVLSRNGRQLVFVLDEENRAHMREVRLGLINDESDEILSGLEAGDRVVISGLDRLQQGTAVEVI